MYAGAARWENVCMSTQTPSAATPSESPVEPRWLTSDELEHWERFVAVLELLPAAIDAQLKRDAGLTHFEYYVLHMLAESPDGAMQLKRLAARTNSSLARLSRVVSGLEVRQAVTRRRHDCDARASDALITDAGRQLLVSTAPQHVAYVRSTIVDALTPEQFAALGAISEQLLEQLDPKRERFYRGKEDDRTPLPELSAPARRALEAAGITSLDELAGTARSRIEALHGVGPAALERIDRALEATGLVPLT